MSAHLVQPPGQGLSDRQVETVASLPATFRTATSGPVRLVDGGPGWAGRAREAIAGGARALVVDRPAPDPIEEVRSVRELARADGVLVVVDSPYVGSPTWLACRDRILADATGAGLVDGVVVVGNAQDLERGLLAQVAAIRPLLHGATLRRAAPGVAVLVTDEATVAASLCATVSVTPGLVLDLVGPRVRWRVELPDDGTARPGRAARYDAAGETVLRPTYSTASRNTWRALAERLSGAPAEVYDLDTFLVDLELLTGA